MRTRSQVETYTGGPDLAKVADKHHQGLLKKLEKTHAEISNDVLSEVVHILGSVA